MLNFENKILDADFPCYTSNQVFENSFYKDLVNQFPNVDDDVLSKETFQGNRHRLQIGSSDYKDFIKKNKTWNILDSYLNSAPFRNYTNNLFKNDDLKKLNENISKFSFKNKIIAKLKNSESLSMDISNSGKNYQNRIHFDRLNRKFVMLLFFCDHDDLKMSGGDFIFHKLKDKNKQPIDERFYKEDDCQEIFRLKPKHNSGVIFLNTKDALHSVDRINRIKGARKFAYIALNLL